MLLPPQDSESLESTEKFSSLFSPPSFYISYLHSINFHRILQRWITKLAIATGAEALTIGIKAVYGNAFFLREVNHAQEIRKKLLLNLMLSENPAKHYLCIKHLELSPFNSVVAMRI